MTFPLILGIDWMNASQGTVTSRDGRAVVIPRSRLLDFVLKDQQTPVTTLPNADSTRHPEDEKSADPSIGEPEQAKADCPNDKREAPPDSGPSSSLQRLCCLAAEGHETLKHQTSASGLSGPETKIKIEPTRSEGIPVGFKCHARFQVPKNSNRRWMTTTFRSRRTGREWMSPSAIPPERNDLMIILSAVEFLGPYQVSQRVGATCHEMRDIPFDRGRLVGRTLNVRSSPQRRFREHAERQPTFTLQFTL